MSKFITIHDANAGDAVSGMTVNTDYIILAKDSCSYERYGRLYIREAERSEEQGWTTRVVDTRESYRELQKMLED